MVEYTQLAMEQVIPETLSPRLRLLTLIILLFTFSLIIFGSLLFKWNPVSSTLNIFVFLLHSNSVASVA
jgi:hypothetical protein